MFTCADIRQDYFISAGFAGALKQIHAQLTHSVDWQLVTAASGMGKTTLATYLVAECSTAQQGVHHLQLIEDLTASDWIWRPLSGFFSGALTHEAASAKANVVSNLEAFKQSGRGVSLIIDGAEHLKSEESWQDVKTLHAIFRRLGPRFAMLFLSEPQLAHNHPLQTTRPIIVPVWSFADTKRFIHDRLHRLGIEQNVFSDDAISVINNHAQGVPLRVVTLSENLLMQATLNGDNPVERLTAEQFRSEAPSPRSEEAVPADQATPQSFLELLRSRRSG